MKITPFFCPRAVGNPFLNNPPNFSWVKLELTGIGMVILELLVVTQNNTTSEIFINITHLTGDIGIYFWVYHGICHMILCALWLKVVTMAIPKITIIGAIKHPQLQVSPHCQVSYHKSVINPMKSPFLLVKSTFSIWFLGSIMLTHFNPWGQTQHDRDSVADAVLAAGKGLLTRTRIEKRQEMVS